MMWLAGTAAMMAAGAAAAVPRAPAPIEVMVLGTWHFNGGGADVVNQKVSPVTSPRRQAELVRVAAALAKFRPTAVAVERIAADQRSLIDQAYPAFTPAKLATSDDERVQIGYRLAAAARLAPNRVWAVDEQDRAGQQSYFPLEDVQAWAKAHGRSAALDRVFDGVRALSVTFARHEAATPIAQLLRERNGPDGFQQDGGIGLYHAMLTFGGGDDWPGADLDARWYARNGRIFAKLMHNARPGDRIVIVYGSGHSYWLRHFAATTPGYRLIEPRLYLPVR